MGWLFDSVTFVKNQNMNLEKNSKIKNPDSEEKISKWKILVNEIRIVLWKCYHVISAFTSDPAHAKFDKIVLITWKDWKLYYSNRNLSCLETFRRGFKLMSLACTLIGWHIKASIWLVKKSNNQFEILDRKIGKMGKKKQSRNCFLAGVSIRWPFMTSSEFRHLNSNNSDLRIQYCEIVDIYIWDPVKSKSS